MLGCAVVRFFYPHDMGHFPRAWTVTKVRPEDRTLGVTTIAKRRGVTVDQVRRWIRHHQLEAAGENRVTAASYRHFLATGGFAGPNSGFPSRRGVYFVQIGEYIKIGHSQDVVTRWRAPTDTPYAPVPLGFIPVGPNGHCSAAEDELHRRFKVYRGRGEWFRDNDELRAYIREHAQPWPEGD